MNTELTVNSAEELMKNEEQQKSNIIRPGLSRKKLDRL